MTQAIEAVLISRAFTLYDRYLFWRAARLYLAILASLLLLVSLFVFTSRIEWLTEKQQSLGLILEYVAASQANFVLVTSPLVFALAGAISISALVRDREWSALSAAGLKDLQILRPLACLAALLIGLEAYLSHFGLAAGKAWTRDIYSQVSADLIGTLAQPQSFQEIEPGLKIFIQARGEDGEFDGLLVHDERDPGETRLVFAEQAKLQAVRDRYTLNISEGQILRFDRKDFGRKPIEVAFRQYQFDLFAIEDSLGLGGRNSRDDEFDSIELLSRLDRFSFDPLARPQEALAILSSRFATTFGSLVMLVFLFHFGRLIVPFRTSFLYPSIALFILVLAFVITHAIFRRWATDWYWALIVNLLVPFAYMVLAGKMAVLSRLIATFGGWLGALIGRLTQGRQVHA